MAFSWKDKRDIFKGEGIFHLTFVVAGRRPLLGELVEIPPAHDRDDRRQTSQWATVRLSQLGFAVSEDLQHIEEHHPGIRLCGKQLMPDHLHVVVWVQKDSGRSIRQVAHGFRIGITKIAKEMGVWPEGTSTGGDDGRGTGKTDVTRPDNMNGIGRAAYSRNQAAGVSMAAGGSVAAGGGMVVGGGGVVPVGTVGACDAPQSPGLILEQPYIRTLAHAGQLRAMIDYVHANPDNAWLRRQHPGLYVIHRRVGISAGRDEARTTLHFDTMGKARLLNWPDRQVIALSRSLTEEQIAAEVQRAVRMAESGTVTYSAAINAGEKAVARAVREAGLPLVVLLLDGFPAEGTEAARYYHPNGVYHTACGNGQLYLMAPLPEDYDNPCVVEQTEQELRKKAEAKGLHYSPIPHSTKRWRMVAGNVMLRMLCDRE